MWALDTIINYMYHISPTWTQIRKSDPYRKEGRSGDNAIPKMCLCSLIGRPNQITNFQCVIVKTKILMKVIEAVKV